MDQPRRRTAPPAVRRVEVQAKLQGEQIAHLKRKNIHVVNDFGRPLLLLPAELTWILRWAESQLVRQHLWLFWR